MPDDTVISEIESNNTSPGQETRRRVPGGYNELGRTGLKHFSGTLYEEWLPQLQGDRGVKIYTEMRDNSPVIGAMLFAIEHLLRSVDWYVEPASDAVPDQEAADFISSCMDDMTHTWEDFISEALSFLPFGWSYFEVVYKKRTGKKPRTNKLRSSRHNDGRIGWGRFGFRAQETLFRWEIDPAGEILGMWQYPTPSTPIDAPSTTVLIPSTKALHFRTTSFKNNPEGRSILRNAYHPWFFAKRIEQIEAVGIERDLAGMPIAKVPIELLATDRTDEETSTYNYIKDIVTKVKRDQQEGIIWPLAWDEDTGNELYQFDLINAEGKRSFDTGGIIQRYQQQMVMTALADFILLGHENVGSFALSSDKTELFAVALGSWLDQIAEVLNRDAVIPLLELNGFDTENPPRIAHGDVEDPDLQLLGDFVSKLAQAGAPMFPDLGLESFLRDAAGMPEIDEEAREEILSQMQPAGLMPGMAPGGEEGGAAIGDPDGTTAPPPGHPGPQTPPPKPTAAVPGEDKEPVAKVNMKPSYYTGSQWRTIRSRSSLGGRRRRSRR